MKQFGLWGKWGAMGGALALGLILATVIRYGILENEAQARLCEAAEPGGWCLVRSAVGWSIYMQLFGLGALLFSVVAWVPRLRQLALPALFLAGCGLFIYNSTWAAVALVVAMLAVLQPRPAAKA